MRETQEVVGGILVLVRHSPESAVVADKIGGPNMKRSQHSVMFEQCGHWIRLNF